MMAEQSFTRASRLVDMDQSACLSEVKHLMGTSKAMVFYDLGLMDYQQAYWLQKEVVSLKKDQPDFGEVVFFVQHPEVYTQGRKSPGLYAGTAQVPVVEIERGGEMTYHNPGQLVVYPLLNLVHFKKDIHFYLRGLEQVLIDVLKQCGVEGERRTKATGVWIKGQEKKIASIGIAIKQWVTYHGVALNVSNSLEGFHRIHPCGFSGQVMTSLQAQGQSVSMGHIKTLFCHAFTRHFDKKLSP